MLLNPVSFYRAINHNLFSQEIEEKILGRCKYMYIYCTVQDEDNQGGIYTSLW